VTLTPRGTVPNQPLQLTIVAARILDDEGEPVPANSGGDFVATLGSKGGIAYMTVRIAAVVVVEPMLLVKTAR
jgi:hypothetical protein